MDIRDSQCNEDKLNIESFKNFLTHILSILKACKVRKNTKLFIILFIYFYIVVTAILVCIFAIINSDNILLDESKSKLILAAQNEARKEEQILLNAEKSLKGLSNYIKLTFDTDKFEDLKYVKNYRDKVMLPGVKEYFNITNDIQGMYAYLDVMRINPDRYVAEAWVTKEKFKININPLSYTKQDPDMKWYYKVKNAQQPEWIEPYWDNDIKKVVISYAKPIYKDENNKINTFIGAVGIDLTSEDLKKSVDKIILYKTGYAFLVSKNYYFIANKNHSIKENLFEINNGYYKPLLSEIQNKDSGITKFGKNLVAFSKLYNGYTLFVVVPENEIFLNVNNLNILLITFTFLAILISTIILLVLLKKLNKLMDSLEASDNIIMTIANSIEAKDVYTKGHVQRVTAYAEKMGKYLKLSNYEMEILRKGSILHDIGKIGVPDDILNKPGRLTEEEFNVMKSHCIFGANILKPLHSYKQIINLVRHHHEKLDGSGYPDGLLADEINLSIRILTIIDIYDALVTERSYKKAFTSEEALAILDKDAEKGLLDRKILEGFKYIIKNDPL